jgi:hypothetical protein
MARAIVWSNYPPVQSVGYNAGAEEVIMTNKTVTLEIPQSEWERFTIELARVVAILQEHQRESEERWERIEALKAETAVIKEELRRRLQDVDKHLGNSEIAGQLR